MDQITLAAAPRDTKVKAKHLRLKGDIPAILYGHGVQSAPLSVKQSDLIKVFRKAGTSTLVELDLGKEKSIALIKEVDRDPVSDHITHVDFHQVKLDEKIKADIPLKFINEAPAVRELEGTLSTPHDAVHVEAFPQDLVHEIEIDISSLKTFEDAIHIKDIVPPKGITILTDPEEMVVTVHPPRSEEELAALEEEVKEDVEAVEVEEKGKEEEVAEGEEGEKTTEGPTPESSQKEEK